MIPQGTLGVWIRHVSDDLYWECLGFWAETQAEVLAAGTSTRAVAYELNINFIVLQRKLPVHPNGLTICRPHTIMPAQDLSTRHECLSNFNPAKKIITEQQNRTSCRLKYSLNKLYLSFTGFQSKCVCWQIKIFQLVLRCFVMWPSCLFEQSLGYFGKV